MQYGGQIIGQPQQLQQINRGNPPMPLHPAAMPSRGLLNQHQQHSLAGSLGAGGLSGSPLTNGLQVGRLRFDVCTVHASEWLMPVVQDPLWLPTSWSPLLSPLPCPLAIVRLSSSNCLCTAVGIVMLTRHSMGASREGVLCCPAPRSTA